MIVAHLFFLAGAFFPSSIGSMSYDSTAIDTDQKYEIMRITHTSRTRVKRPVYKPTRVHRTGTRVTRPKPKYCSFIDVRELPRECPNTDDPTTPRRNNRDVIQTQVQTAVRTLKVPALTAVTQPGDQALINIPTILYTTPVPFTRDVTLLGQTIRIQADPAAYRWHHGDNTSQTTRTPGAPYPRKDVTHTYTKPQANTRVRVDTIYRIRYRLPDGTWQTVPDTLTITGPTTTLTIHEARPYLTNR